MGLALKSHTISIAFGTVSFFMADDDRTIRVDIGQDLLARVGGPPPATKDGYVKRLVRHQRQFAQIAALKYHRGLYEPEVRVLVVRITANDLL